MATVPFAIRVFMRAHVETLRQEYDVTLFANGDSGELIDLLGSHVMFRRVKIMRKVSIGLDFLALIDLWRQFRRDQFDAVHSIMPKSGLLAMLAARLAGVPVRVHVFTGQVWATAAGARRQLLRLADTVLAMNATRVLADSRSQRAFLIESGVVKATDIGVLADGSVAGVDVERFSRCPVARERIRSERNIPGSAIVFLFLGRLTRDKGLHDLAAAFVEAAYFDPCIQLFVVGPDEEGFGQLLDTLGARFPARVHRAGFAERPEDYMSASDVLCLPSYREGFGSVIIEAASVGLPAIASRIYGITDSVIEGVTGVLHEPGSSKEIASAMLWLASSERVRAQMGEAARLRVRDQFSESRVTTALVEFYRHLFTESARG
ncbi:MAG: glycosyltransferase [Gemmatimonadota bacterium]|nr:glycosyltransferase [Gemmatimonadota bacterium]